jgi:outer membrane immunogenic protein
MKMLGYAAAVVAPLVAFTQVEAADMRAPVAKAPTASACAAAKFQGGYIGIHGGGVYHSAYRQDQGVSVLDGADEGNILNTFGGAVGGHIGYSWTSCNTLWGIEFDGSWTSNNKFRRTDPLTSEDTGGISSRLNAVLTARTRAGVAFDSMLLYVTGGAAAIRTETVYSAVEPNFTESATVKDWRLGWVAGFGSDWAWSDRWTLRSEFLYIGTPDRGYSRTTVGTDVEAAFFNQHDSVFISRVGLTYRFGG